MAAPTASYDINDTGTLSPLPGYLRHGLVAVSVFALISFLASFALMVHLTQKLIRWQLKQRRAARTSASHSGQSVAPNQFLVLIVNLLLADIKQSTAFMLNVAWLRRDAVEAGTPVCAAQGWFVSSGDLASSMFVLAIATHTYLAIVKDYRLSTGVFYGIIGGLWLFVYVISALGWAVAAARGGDLYTRAGAWCWVNGAYQDVRLLLHYLWLFIAMAVTSVLYVIIFIHIQTQYRKSPDNADEVSLSRGTAAHYATETTEAIDGKSPATVRAVMTPLPGQQTPSESDTRTPQNRRQHAFLLYPLIYVVCTAPLVAGRIATMTGREVSLQYLCFAGAMIACNGWLDVFLYSTTRHAIVFGADVGASDMGLDTFAFMGTAGPNLGNTTVVEGGLRSASDKGHKAGRGKGSWSLSAFTFRLGGKDDEDSSVGEGNDVALKGLGQIQAETTTMVVHEEGEYELPPKQQNVRTKRSAAGSATSKPASVRSMV